MDLQGLVDRLGDRLQRSVAIDDPRLRLIAHSAHHGQGDEVRRHLVLEREPPPEAFAWAMRHGLRDATEVVRLPGNDDLGLLPRVAIPIRWEGHTLAYLWLIDAAPAVTDEEIEIARRAADQAAVLLSRERLAAQLARTQEGVGLRNLLDEDPRQRAQTAVELVDRDLFVAGPCRCVTVHLGAASHTVVERERLALDEVVHAVPRSVGPRHAIAVARHDHAVILVSTADPVVARGGILSFAARLRDDVTERLRGDDARVVAAFGAEQESLAAAFVSYRQALHAASVATVVPDLGPVADWEQLGVYRLLVEFGTAAPGPDVLHPALTQLLNTRDPTGPRLLDALEAFLDEAGNTPRAAARLQVHRSTLHHRLRRISELTGVDLDNGHDRLALHLGLKLLRLAPQT